MSPVSTAATTEEVATEIRTVATETDVLECTLRHYLNSESHNAYLTRAVDLLTFSLHR